MKGKHFVLGSGKGTTIHDAIVLVSNLVAQETGEKVDVKCVEPPPGLHQIELRNFIANIDILKKMGVINEMYDISNGLKKSLANYKRIIKND